TRCDPASQPPCSLPRARGRAGVGAATGLDPTARSSARVSLPAYPGGVFARMSAAGMTRARVLRLGLGAAPGAWLPTRSLGGHPAGAARHDFWFTRLKYDSGNWDVDERMPANLIASLIDYPGLRVDPKEHVVELADPKMLSAPFCYLAGHKLV